MYKQHFWSKVVIMAILLFAAGIVAAQCGASPLTVVEVEPAGMAAPGPFICRVNVTRGACGHPDPYDQEKANE